jgi:gamma-glutamylaminecyclotransferase
MGRRLFYGTLTVAPPGDALLEGATFVERARTSPRYRLFSLDGFPVLVEDAEDGRSLEVQVWEVPDERWKRILESEPPQMRHAAVELQDGRTVDTLVGPRDWVEARAGLDVSEHGSWAAYRAASR